MINKVAEMTRLAEVRGCLAAFHDAGLIKVASEEAFDGLCEQVADMIGYDYDLEKVAQATDALIAEDYNRQMKKTAGVLGNAGRAIGNALSLKGVRNVHAGNVAAKKLLDGKVPNPNNLPLDPRDIVRAKRSLSRGNKIKNYAKAGVAPALAYGGVAGALGTGALAARHAYNGYVGE